MGTLDPLFQCFLTYGYPILSSPILCLASGYSSFLTDSLTRLASKFQPSDVRHIGASQSCTLGQSLSDHATQLRGMPYISPLPFLLLVWLPLKNGVQVVDSAVNTSASLDYRWNSLSCCRCFIFCRDERNHPSFPCYYCRYHRIVQHQRTRSCILSLLEIDSLFSMSDSLALPSSSGTTSIPSQTRLIPADLSSIHLIVAIGRIHLV